MAICIIVQSLAGEKNRPAIVYAHGGGCIGGSADLYKGFLAHMAVDCRVVVFNVDYRLAPETRSRMRGFVLYSNS